MNIMSAKLVTGEEIICKYEHNEENFTITDVRLIIPVPQHDNKGVPTGMAININMPWSVTISTENGYPLSKKDIMASNFTLPKELEDAYIEATSSIALTT